MAQQNLLIFRVYTNSGGANNLLFSFRDLTGRTNNYLEVPGAKRHDNVM